MNNPYLDFARSLLPSPRRQKVRTVPSEAHAPMVPRGAEKALAERSKQFSKARRWNKQELKALLDGPHGMQVKRIICFLNSMGIEDGRLLLALLDNLDWLERADLHTRMLILGEIDDAIITLRVCNGLSPIDDALPGEEPTVFQTVKEKLIPEEQQRKVNYEYRQESSSGIRRIEKERMAP
jgi:hypothetical protein